jgi:hypothetical protein
MWTSFFWGGGVQNLIWDVEKKSAVKLHLVLPVAKFEVLTVVFMKIQVF